MTSQPATSPTLTPDRLFGPLDEDLAHRTSLLPPPKAPVMPIAFPATARDAAPSYCAWPAVLVAPS